MLRAPAESEKTTCANYIVFGLTWPGTESTIYRTWGKHANHYATDAVNKCLTFNLVNIFLLNISEVVIISILRVW